MRLIPTALAGFELHVLFKSAVQLLAQSGHFAASGAWLPSVIACLVVFFLRETGRGLLAVLAVGQLLGAVGSLNHEHSLTSSLLTAGQLPVLVGTPLFLAAGLAAWRLAIVRGLAATHRRWSSISPPGQPQSRSEHFFLPALAPLVAGASGRGPPALLAL